MTDNQQDLRSGYTTGACATAAAKAALSFLMTGQKLEHVSIELPIGERATFSIHDQTQSGDTAAATVIKDAGDDPDATHGAAITATVRRATSPGVSFVAGEGLGVVTRPGLSVAAGEAAINPVPRRMIQEHTEAVLSAHGLNAGLQVEVSVAGGADIAKKTFNPRLGIEGGISILGTTGVVVPYSTAAWRASVLQGIDVARAQGQRHIVLTVGGRGEKLAKRWIELPDYAYIQIGPFFGESLEHAATSGIEQITLVSMIGKLAKFAAGNDSVHSGHSAQDFDFLASIAAEVGAASEAVDLLRQANTAQQAATIMERADATVFFKRLCEHAHTIAARFSGGCNNVTVLLLASDGRFLGQYPE